MRAAEGQTGSRTRYAIRCSLVARGVVAMTGNKMRSADTDETPKDCVAVTASRHYRGIHKGGLWWCGVRCVCLGLGVSRVIKQKVEAAGAERAGRTETVGQQFPGHLCDSDVGGRNRACLSDGEPVPPLTKMPPTLSIGVKYLVVVLSARTSAIYLVLRRLAASQEPLPWKDFRLGQLKSTYVGSIPSLSSMRDETPRAGERMR